MRTWNYPEQTHKCLQNGGAWFEVARAGSSPYTSLSSSRVSYNLQLDFWGLNDRPDTSNVYGLEFTKVLTGDAATNGVASTSSYCENTMAGYIPVWNVVAHVLPAEHRKNFLRDSSATQRHEFKDALGHYSTANRMSKVWVGAEGALQAVHGSNTPEPWWTGAEELNAYFTAVEGVVVD